MNLLARREHSQQELQRKLLSKGFESTDIKPVLARLAEQGLLSDARFTEAFINSRLKRGSGPIRIAMELQERGIGDDLVSAYLDERDVQWTQSAVAVRTKRFGPSLPNDFKERVRQMRFLQYRGFTLQQIQQAVGEEID
jgi:regulatory protein